MPKTILVATDMSARSDLAVRRALRLATQLEARVTVAHVVDDAAPPDISGQMRAASLAALDRFVASIAGNVPVEIRVDMGDPTADIIDLAGTIQPDLVVLGSHRPRPFLDAMRETTAQRITRLLDCPVLMVCDRDDHDYDSIVTATDFSPAAAAAASLAAALAPSATITPVHVFHVPYSGMIARGATGQDEIEASFRKEATEEDRRWRDAQSLPDTCTDTVMIAGSPLQAITDHARDSGASLVCVGAHGRVGQGRAFLGSVASDLMRMPPCDVLVARPT